MAKSDHLLSFDHPFSLRTLPLVLPERQRLIVGQRAKITFLPPLTTTFTPQGGWSVIGWHYGIGLRFRAFFKYWGRAVILIFKQGNGCAMKYVRWRNKIGPAFLQIAHFVQFANTTLHGIAHNFQTSLANGLQTQVIYRIELKGFYVVFSRTHAGPGRAVKLEQKENSRNHVQAF